MKTEFKNQSNMCFGTNLGELNPNKFRSIFCLLVFIGCQIGTLNALNFANTPELLQYVSKYVQKNPTILEAGGHHGEDTIVMKKIWPTAIIHVFEPNPNSFLKLMTNINKLPGIFPYELALSNMSGKINFYIDMVNDGACSIDAPVDFNKHEFNKEPIPVTATTLNIWGKEYGINHVDFMWLDMEGHELKVLKESSDFLHTVNVVYTEVDFQAIRENPGLYGEVKALLESYGLVEVLKEDYGRFGNALFIKKELL